MRSLSRPCAACGWNVSGITHGKLFARNKRYGKANQHDGHAPHDRWLFGGEKRKLIFFHERSPLEGYRRLAFMMID